ncbi:MAG: hypothetical protein LBE02_02185, partial [Spirochaetaceae bacterium]|nr:hypothetical protein [Spirochaetaceae bacterium]
MGRDLLDIYRDYLLYSRGRTTATGLSNLPEGEVSHDKITRFLSWEQFDEKTLWKKVKKAVRAFEREEAAEKPADEERDDAGDDTPPYAKPGTIPVYIGRFVVFIG